MINHFSIFQPNAWDNSIVPINIVHKLINQMNELIDVVNAIEDVGFERAKAYTDEQVAVINARISDIQRTIVSISEYQTQLNTRITTLDERETGHYNTLTTAVEQLNARIDYTRNELKNYTDISILELKNQLETEIEEIKRLVDNLLDVKTIDGLTGELKTVRQILGTQILNKVKLVGGNRYSLTWGQLSTETNNGWLATYSQRIYGSINFIAPTWYNFMRNNAQFTAGQKSNLYSSNMNTWSAFCDNTLLFIGELVHKIIQYHTSSTQVTADNYKYIDTFTYSDWLERTTDPTALVTTQVNVDITGLYDGTNTIASLIKEQFKKSIDIFTGYVAGYGLYSSSATSANSLFNGTNDLPRLIQFLAGNSNTIFDSDTF